jgi:hypothetical protein
MTNRKVAGADSILVSSTKRRKTYKKKIPLEFPTESAPYLQIESVPLEQRVDPSQHRYWLILQPHGVRAAGGQFTSDEAHEIAKATRGWDWSLDECQRPKCLPRLEALLNQICKRNQIDPLNKINKQPPATAQNRINTSPNSGTANEPHEQGDEQS